MTGKHSPYRQTSSCPNVNTDPRSAPPPPPPPPAPPSPHHLIPQSPSHPPASYHHLLLLSPPSPPIFSPLISPFLPSLSSFRGVVCRGKGGGVSLPWSLAPVAAPHAGLSLPPSTSTLTPSLFPHCHSLTFTVTFSSHSFLYLFLFPPILVIFAKHLDVHTRSRVTPV